MLILTANTLKVVTGQKILLASNKKSNMDFRLAYLHWTMAYSKGHAHFDYKYLANDNRTIIAMITANITIFIHEKLFIRMIMTCISLLALMRCQIL